ncbi:MAG: glucuronate isomerase [Clostridia bacterium]|nr:glucuronate isomerase [Clostridia bacterium]
MNKMITANFLLETAPAQKIYKEIKNLPIIDYHCHIDAKEIYENKVFDTVTQIWLGGDHYKWRAMRNMGVDERLITGDAPDFDKFYAYASVIPYMAGHPLFHFSHLELDKYFGISDPLTPKNAQAVYDKANKMLPKLPARKIIEMSGVEVIITTNDPLEDLQYHKLLTEDGSLCTKVLPAFRPDKAINIENPCFSEYISKLSKLTNRSITSLADLKHALKERLLFFIENGARASDHGITYVPYVKNYKLFADEALKKTLKGIPISDLEADSYKTSVLVYLAELYAANNMVMELHFGCTRNPNSVMYQKLGADTGFDTIRRDSSVDNLPFLLDEMNKRGSLPKTILYSLEPGDDNVIGTIMGSFHEKGIKGKVQQGSAWWFNDNKPGMEKQIGVYATQSPLDTFIGMLTDSRSFLSYPRHDYFRRILSNFLGNLITKGEYPAQNIDYLIETAKNIAYNNVKQFIFGSEKAETEEK